MNIAKSIGKDSSLAGYRGLVGLIAMYAKNPTPIIKSGGHWPPGTLVPTPMNKAIM